MSLEFFSYADKVNKSPMNHSTAKMMYSFPREQRFENNYGKNSSKTIFYQVPEIRDLRATSIGYGRKSDFTKVDDIKKVPFYNFKNTFDRNVSGAPSYSFGASRDSYDKVVCFNNILLC